MEYRKAYNHLRARKQRGKTSSDVWHTVVARAQGLLDFPEQGKLTDEKVWKMFAAFFIDKLCS